jgi:hypothetical protein
VAVDPTGKFTYVTDFQTDTGVAGYSIGSNGALTPLPGSPFAAEVGALRVAITPYVPFAAFFAKLEVEGGYRPGFEQEAFFILGGTSNGINPVTENVTLQIGTFSVTIPAGSFQQDSRLFRFDGVINDLKLQVQIVSLTNNLFILKANGSGVDLTSLTNPVTVGLTIGIDSGSTEVIARFEKETRPAK